MFLSSIIRFVRRYMRYRATLAELNGLDDRTLRDIGLNRTQILSVAWHDGGR